MFLLHIIRQDCGTQAALAVARELVVYLTRSGDQSQYAPFIEWQLHDDEPLARLAGDLLSTGMPAARVATRVGFGDVQTLRRAFQRQLGTTLGNMLNGLLRTDAGAATTAPQRNSNRRL